MMLAMFGCFLSCAFCCSKEERKGRSERKHLKAKAQQSSRNLEMPKMRGSSMSSAGPDDSIFKGVNPMSSGGDSSQAVVVGKKSKQWIELVDEASGQRYYENVVTGETTWEKPESFN
jgi:hypothetical protein